MFACFRLIFLCDLSYFFLVQAQPQVVQSNDFGFGTSGGNDDFGFGTSTTTTTTATAAVVTGGVSGGGDDFGFGTSSTSMQQTQAAAAQPSRPMTMNERAKYQSGGGNDLFNPTTSNTLDLFGSSDATNNTTAASTNVSAMGTSQVTADVAVTTGVTTTIQETKKEDEKKSSNDAWELGKKFTDLSNLSAQGGTKLVAFDPDKQKKGLCCILLFVCVFVCWTRLIWI